jgi:hypothetical protein
MSTKPVASGTVGKGSWCHLCDIRDLDRRRPEDLLPWKATGASDTDQDRHAHRSCDRNIDLTAYFTYN